jgi:hypothetical protein
LDHKCVPVGDLTREWGPKHVTFARAASGASLTRTPIQAFISAEIHVDVMFHQCELCWPSGRACKRLKDVTFEGQRPMEDPSSKFTV